MKKFINSVIIALFGYIPFKSIYKPPAQKIEFGEILKFMIDKTSVDSRRFNNWLS